jgi:predicted ATPase
VVDEAATDVIARQQALGRDEPWLGAGFVDVITGVHRQRQEQPAPPGSAVQVYDRSPICTRALAGHLGRSVTAVLAAEVDRVVRDRIYQPHVFFVHLLGFVTPTAARRITLAQSRRFEELHEQAHRAHGYELVDVPAGTVEERATLVDRYLRSWTDTPPGGP